MAGHVDLTLRLGRSSSAGDGTKKISHPMFNAKFGVPNVTQLGLGSGFRIPGATLGNNDHAVPFSSTSVMEFQRSLYFRNEPVALSPPTRMMEYCVINVSNHRGRVGGSKKRKVTAPAYPPPPPPPALRLFNDFRFCTNINCRKVETPMWRRGPLGPKTLCNACGIKYRKTMPLLEEELN